MASQLKLAQKIGQKQKASTTTTWSSGQSLLAADYPLLAAELSKSSEETGAGIARKGSLTGHVKGVGGSTSSYGARVQTTLTTQGGISRGKSRQTQQPTYSGLPSRSEPYYGDTNQRGEKITVRTLANYMRENELYDAEAFMKNATQMGDNRGTEIYDALCLKDWDKKLSQAVDICQSKTPDTPFRARVENYQVPDGFDLWRGTATYNEYLELFRHHGIGDDKLRRWFKTLFGDNGKKNTIYMWGKADAGKTTIIKLFDAFYHKWEIGRCAAQSINSNFWLQDLYMKRLFHADEIVATQVNIDTLKLLLEGSDDLTTDIKYAKKVSIKGRPVMMATNDPIWINMSTAADPIRKRCEFIKFTRAWTKPAPFMSTKDKNILQYVQNRLFKELFPNGYDEWLAQDMFQQGIEEITDEELAEIEIAHPFNVDDFVSEMN